jgi:hypothetical protein
MIIEELRERIEKMSRANQELFDRARRAEAERDEARVLVREGAALWEMGKETGIPHICIDGHLEDCADAVKSWQVGKEVSLWDAPSVEGEK